MIIGTVKRVSIWVYPHNIVVKRISPQSNKWPGAKIVLDRLLCFQDFLPGVASLPLAEREAARVNVHLGDADESQRGREAEPRGDWTLTQQVRQLVPLLQAKGGVIEHPAMQVARLLYL